VDVIILNVFLTFVCRIDVGLGILDEITPSNTTDIRGFAMPVDNPVLELTLVACSDPPYRKYADHCR